MLTTADPLQKATIFCVDLGTTNARVWLLHNREVVARATAPFGVRDAARQGSSTSIGRGLRALLENVSASAVGTPPAQLILGAGMITSSLGLKDVPHLSAPVGRSDLSAGVKRLHRHEVSDLDILLVPGIRTLHDGEVIDMMRGEETLCIGLLALGALAPGGMLLNLGSHWKAIQTDANGRIVSSVTTLSGELIHAVQSQTILAGALPQGRLEQFDMDWTEAGMKEQRNSGLARALFFVRLLEQQGRTNAEQRMAFLLGACVASDLDAWLRQGLLHRSVLISGGGAVAQAWRWALQKQSIAAEICSAAQIESAMLTGLQRICAEHLSR